jgi:predicted PurR-regulated permease PerM
VRGIALVGVVDAVLIGIALVIIGVPLVVPLMVITFFAAFVPLIGAFVAGLVAVLVALVSGGLVDALLVLGAIILVQQVEGHLLYPVLMSRTVHLHPAVIVVALAAGGILGGIVGVFLAVPVAGVLSVILDYSQDHPPPESPLLDEGAATG